MATPPFIARVAVGAVIYLIEESRKLPELAASAPVAAVSAATRLSVQAQQFIGSLAAIGDQFFESLEPAPETASWATFDDEDDAQPNLSIVKPG